MPSNRLKLLCIGVEDLIQMLCLCLGQEPTEFFNTLEADPPLPEDVQIIGCNYEWDTRTMAFTLQSETFDEVPAGSLLWRIPCKMQLRQRECINEAAWGQDA